MDYPFFKVLAFRLTLVSCLSLSVFSLYAQGGDETVPYSVTNFLLSDNSFDYTDLADLTAQIFEQNGSCLPFNIVVDPVSSVRTEQVETYVNTAYATLFSRIEPEGGSTAPSLINVGVAPLVLLERPRFPHQYFRDQLYKNWDSEGAYEDYSIVLYVVAGQLANTTGIYIDNQASTLLNVVIGENYLLRDDFSALERLIANSFGLPPLWGDGRNCDSDDGIEDTPNHTGPIYDCFELHYNGCYGHIESMNNLMDARLCDFDKWLTTNQKAFLTEFVDNVQFGECDSPRREEQDAFCDAIVSRSGLLTKDVDYDVSLQEGVELEGVEEVAYFISNSSRVVAKGQLDLRKSQKVNMQSLNLVPGHYTISLKGEFGVCTSKTIIL